MSERMIQIGNSSVRAVGTVLGLDLHNRGIVDLTPLVEFKELKSLTLWGNTDLVDLAPLAKLKNLEILDLEGCGRITDLSPLFGLPKLRSLCLDGCGLLDYAGGVETLPRLKAEDSRRSRDHRAVRTSLRTGLWHFRTNRTYILSMRYHGLPDR